MRKILFIPIVMLISCYSIPFVQEGEGKALDKLSKADELFKQQKYEEAVPLYENVIKNRYLLLDPYKHLEICYEKTGRNEEAINVLEKSMLVTNRDEENLKNLIRLYNKVGRMEDAKKTEKWLNYVKSEAIGGIK